ncbi:hypothetical protein KKD34_00465 [bacterium]|nr:hypothetical protein [bacterium]MBU4560803.1 hypothetical protein [bacterium]
MKKFLRFITLSLILLLLTLSSLSVFSIDTQDIIFNAMDKEMKRSMKKLKIKDSPKPYFVKYIIEDVEEYRISGDYGVVKNEDETRNRYYHVEVRIGDYTFDQTVHPAEKSYDPSRFEYVREIRNIPFPMENDVKAIRNALWLHTDLVFKQAVNEYSAKLAKVKSEVVEEEKIEDFSKEVSGEYQGALKVLAINKDDWRNRLRKYSLIFKEYPGIDEANIYLNIEVRNRYLMTSEGTKISYGTCRYWLSTSVNTMTDDGMEIRNYRDFEGWKEEDLPGDEIIISKIREMCQELVDMKEAKVIEPYSGPVLLKGDAAGVFFHEVFGHRIEGHRQKSKEEAETFKNKIGERILPEFVSICDNPAIKYYQGKPVAGYYPYDEEGVISEKVTLVKDGVLKTFLMSRMPVKGFNKSNGHGRLQIEYSWYRDLVPRQGNLIIEASQTVEESELEKRLIEECRKQNKPNGIIVTTTAGGATFTGRFWIQSFVQIPLVIYKLNLDGSKEMLRGARFGGTPLVSLDKIVCFGDKPHIFNGYCGAESGYLPVSAVSPSVIISSLELQKEPTKKEKPPLLPSPLLERSKE